MPSTLGCRSVTLPTPRDEGVVQLWFWELAFLFPQGVVWKVDLVSFWLQNLPPPPPYLTDL